MSTYLLVSVNGPDRRVALVEHNVTTELMIEHAVGTRLVGNIYKGRVVRVLPGMQSAFIEIGLQRTAFLFAGDLVRDEVQLLDDEGSPEDAEMLAQVPINERLTEGQDLIVQVSKEPMGSKGARVTNQLSLAGRYLVMLPSVNNIGLSRRITDDTERERLRAIAEQISGGQCGLIIRTVCQGTDEEHLADDLEFLQTQWSKISQKAKKSKSPSLLHGDLDLPLKAMRDLLRPDFEAVYVDDPSELKIMRSFAETYMPSCKKLLKLYTEDTPLFTHFGVEQEFSRAMNQKVWLKSGGYIVIDHTEALTAIDVNSGRYTGKTNFEDTLLKINLEAVKEIAYQLRLRNIGGIIVIDFIDMAPEEHQIQVHQALVNELKADRARCKVLPMSPLGLVEMTRKRVRQSLTQMMAEDCEHCDGRGWTLSRPEITRQILARVRDTVASRRDMNRVIIDAHPRIVEALYEDYREQLEALEQQAGINIDAQSRELFHLERWDVRGR